MKRMTNQLLGCVPVVLAAMLATVRVVSAQALPPPNNTCESAVPINNGDLYVGSNVGATPLPNPPDDGISRSGAVWHVLKGTGEKFRVTTCHGLTGAIDTVLDVFAGSSCGEAVYTGLSNDNVANGLCPDGYSAERSLLEIQTTPGETYYVTVSGKNPTWLYPEDQYALVVVVGDPKVTCSLDPVGPLAPFSYAVGIGVTPNVGIGLSRLTAVDDTGGSASVYTYDGDKVELRWSAKAKATFLTDGTAVLTGRYVTLEASSSWGGAPCKHTVNLDPGKSGANP